jgi:hypothetical protein
MHGLFGWGKSDMGEHRVSMLGAALRRYEDPARSADPRIRQLVAHLATLDPAEAPRAHFRAELRSQLVAVAPRLVAEGTAPDAPSPTRATRSTRAATTPAHAATPASSVLRARLGRVGQVSIARPLGVITAVAVVFALLLSGAVFASNKALPGESLYGLKRANENIQLSFAGGDTAKGRAYLDFAKTRAQEIAALLKHASASALAGGPSADAGVNAHTAHLIASTLDAADNELRSGAQLLGGQAARSGSGSPLAIMIGWAPDQLKRLAQIAERLPPGSLFNRTVRSVDLTAQAYGRAKNLQQVVDCKCLTKAATDQLGPVPCTTGCTTASRPGPSTTPTSATPPSAGKGTTPNPASTSTSPTGGNNSSTAPGGTSSGSSSASGGILPPLPVPLPSVTLLPSLPGSASGSTSTSAGTNCTIDILGLCIPLQ